MTPLTQKKKLELLEIFNDISLTKYQAIEQIWQKAQDEILDELELWDKPKWEFIILMRNRKEKLKDDR